MWTSACLLAAPFTNTVIELYNLEVSKASRSIAEIYNLNVTEARRDLETVQNWLAFLTPETLSRNP